MQNEDKVKKKHKTIVGPQHNAHVTVLLMPVNHDTFDDTEQMQISCLYNCTPKFR